MGIPLKSHLKCTTLRKCFIQIGHLGLHILYNHFCDLSFHSVLCFQNDYHKNNINDLKNINCNKVNDLVFLSVSKYCARLICSGGICIGGICPGGKCPGGKCPGGYMSSSKCPGGGGGGGGWLCPRSLIHTKRQIPPIPNDCKRLDNLSI